jgi:hypothetical protein
VHQLAAVLQGLTTMATSPQFTCKGIMLGVFCWCRPVADPILGDKIHEWYSMPSWVGGRKRVGR